MAGLTILHQFSRLPCCNLTTKRKCFDKCLYQIYARKLHPSPLPSLTFHHFSSLVYQNPKTERKTFPLLAVSRSFSGGDNALSFDNSPRDNNSPATPENEEFSINSLSLIGTITEEPGITWEDDGGCWTKTTLQVFSKTGGGDIFALLAEEPEAGDTSFPEFVVNSISVGDEVLVEGSFQLRQLPFSPFGGPVEPVVVIENIFKVDRSLPLVSTNHSSPEKNVPHESWSLEKKWKHFFENPKDYWDNRNSKFSDRSPDFKYKKEGGVALWVTSRGRPSWVQTRLKELEEKQT